MIPATHEIAHGAIFWLFIASLAIPFLLAVRFGVRTAAAAAAAWALQGFALFFFLDVSVTFGEAVGVALFVFAVPWLVAALAGLAVRRRRTPG